jgi:hypothetical protein
MVMKNRINIWICSYAVIGVVLMFSIGCKKDNPDPQVPVFTVTANTVQLQGGGEGLQFFAKCTNEDVKMTKVTYTSPSTIQTATYDFNGNSIAKNAQFSLQDDNLAQVKELGTWSFTFEGKRTSDNESFSVNATLLISSK